MVNKRPGGNRLHLEAGHYRSPCNSQEFPATHSHWLAHVWCCHNCGYRLFLPGTSPVTYTGYFERNPTGMTFATAWLATRGMQALPW